MNKNLAQLIANIRYESRLLEKSSLIRIPKYRYKRIIKIKESSENEDEITGKIKFTLKKIPKNNSREYLAKRIYASFKFEYIDIDEFIEDSRDEFIYDIDDNLFGLNRSSLEKQVKSQIEKLSTREQKIICYYFGFKNGKEYTLKKIGKIFGITNERIRQIKKKAIKKLRDSEELKELYET